jgi:hypothetical protein
MTDRKTLDQMTSDDLDQLYEQLERAQRVACDTLDDGPRTRVIALYEEWVKAGPPPFGTSLARWWDQRLVELHDAILNSAAANNAARTTANNADHMREHHPEEQQP